MGDTYCFRVKGHLNDHWSDWLGGLAIHLEEDGTSVLVGPVVDQAALHGVILRIRDLGLPLLSVRRVSGATVVPTGDECIDRKDEGHIGRFAAATSDALPMSGEKSASIIGAEEITMELRE